MKAKFLKGNLTNYLFVVPAFILFIVFVVYPIFYNIQASFLQWDGVNAGTNVGVDNYKKLASDPIFHTTLINSLLWMVFTIIPQSAIGFFLALALNEKLHGRTTVSYTHLTLPTTPYV